MVKIIKKFHGAVIFKNIDSFQMSSLFEVFSSIQKLLKNCKKKIDFETKLISVI